MMTGVIAGISFRAGAKEYIAKLPSGEPLILKADPANINDGLAIEVRHGEVQLGFVGAKELRGLQTNRDFHRAHELWPSATLVRSPDNKQARVRIGVVSSDIVDDHDTSARWSKGRAAAWRRRDRRAFRKKVVKK